MADTKNQRRTDAAQDAADDAADKRVAGAGATEAAENAQPNAPPYVATRADPEPIADDEKAHIAKTRGELKTINEQLVDKAAARQKADAEYAALTAEASMKNAELLRLVGTPSRRPTTVVEYAAQAKRNREPMVNCIIPKPFQLRLDDHTLIDVQAGVRQVPKSLADHWWFRANGVVAQE